MSNDIEAAASAAYAHDHDDCVFLGPHEGFDLYFCTQGGAFPTVIARASDEPSDYISGLALADHDPLLGEARRRASERGLLDA